jgi:hypothetical protein
MESKPTYHMTGRREDVKSTYVTADYVLGAAQIGTVLEWGWANNQIKAWSLGFRSDKRLVEITSNHPFYPSGGDDPENAYQGYSPYQRLLHWRGVLLAVYNIPKEDPHQVVNVRIPKGLDQLVEADGWVFVAEGNAYAAIRPVAEAYKLLDADDGWLRLRIGERQCGLVVEAGRKARFPTLDAFAAAIRKAGESLRYDRASLEYTSTAGDKLRLRYFPPRPHAVCTVNGKLLDWSRWKAFDSPYVWSDVGSRVLHVTDGQEGFVVDFSAPTPVFSALKAADHRPDVPRAEATEAEVTE